MSRYHHLERVGAVNFYIPFPVAGADRRKPYSAFSKCQVAAKPIVVENTGDNDLPVTVKVMKPSPDSFMLSEKPRSDPGSCFTTILKARQKLSDGFWLSFLSGNLGLHTAFLRLEAGDFQIKRPLQIDITVANEYSELLKGRTCYHKEVAVSIPEIKRSTEPRSKRMRTTAKEIDMFIVPKHIRALIRIQKQDYPVPQCTYELYNPHFTSLLQMEEVGKEQDLAQYKKEGVKLRKLDDVIVVDLPKPRPAITANKDYLFLTPSGSTYYSKGRVCKVTPSQVHLEFDSEFHLEANQYDVSFCYNRLPFRQMYHALKAAASFDKEFLFPDSLNRRTIDTYLQPLVPIAGKINDEQRLAVERILKCKGGAPYVIYGPPGTGKTRTIREAILQLGATQDHHHILVCAPSNTAADDLLEKILSTRKVDEWENLTLLRLNARSRSLRDIEPHHLQFCSTDGGVFTCPPDLEKYKIVISTYGNSYLLTDDLMPGHFSHIFLDEAAQASEPESMVPISAFWKKHTVVVLAGDHQQLGPVLTSELAISKGLGRSFMERLCTTCPCYMEEDPNYVTKLVVNYRSDPQILELPSTLFYGGALIADNEHDEVSSCLLTKLTFTPPKTNTFPIGFFGIRGIAEKEVNGTSWFNTFEASKVLQVINQLTEAGDHQVAVNEIGVITPYQSQVAKIKSGIMKSKESIPMVMCGSVEQFQGQEKKVVIMTTVRSSTMNNRGKKQNLQFLSDRRRFNVAITRAKHLLIIVGDPYIINEDPLWSKLLWLCVNKNTYKGCDLPAKLEHKE